MLYYIEKVTAIKPGIARFNVKVSEDGTFDGEYEIIISINKDMTQEDIIKEIAHQIKVLAYTYTMVNKFQNTTWNVNEYNTDLEYAES